MRSLLLSALLLLLSLAAAVPGAAEPPCGNLTREDAAAILGLPVEEVEFQFSPELSTCTFGTGLFQRISYSLYFEADQETARQELEAVVSGLRTLVECVGLEGPGDQTVSCDGDRASRLLVRSQAVWADIRLPKELERKLQVAASLFE